MLILGSAVCAALAGCSTTTEQSGSPETSRQSEGAPAGPEATTSRPADEDDDPFDLSYGISQEPLSGEGATEGGWFRVEPDGDRDILRFDVRLCMPNAFDATVTESGASAFTLDFAPKRGTGEGPTESTETTACDSVTHVVGIAYVPAAWNRVVITRNGEELRAVQQAEYDGTRLSLPDPLRL